MLDLPEASNRRPKRTWNSTQRSKVSAVEGDGCDQDQQLYRESLPRHEQAVIHIAGCDDCDSVAEPPVEIPRGSRALSKRVIKSCADSGC